MPEALSVARATVDDLTALAEVLGQPVRADELDSPRPAGSRRWWVARRGGQPRACARVDVRDAEDRGVPGELLLAVHPDHRRQGLGSEVLDAVVQEMADSIGSLVAEVEVGSPAAAFLAARGFTEALSVTYLRLDVAARDREASAATAAAPPPGYSLVTWVGAPPEKLVPAMAAARSAMADAPTGELAAQPVTWSDEEVRRVAATVAARGDLLVTAAALGVDGSIAGYTELVVDGRSRTSAQQYDTVVVAPHRGHGLGAFLKAALLEHVLREEAPGLEEVVADNADDNVHMLRVNLRLGYVPVRRVVHVQRALQGAPAVNPRGGR